MARRAPVDGRAATIDVLRHMGRHLHRPQIFNEVLCVIGLVGTQRDRLCPVGEVLDHVQRADDGDADRIVGKLGTAIGRSGQA